MNHSHLCGATAITTGTTPIFRECESKATFCIINNVQHVIRDGTLHTVCDDCTFHCSNCERQSCLKCTTYCHICDALVCCDCVTTCLLPACTLFACKSCHQANRLCQASSLPSPTTTTSPRIHECKGCNSGVLLHTTLETIDVSPCHNLGYVSDLRVQEQILVVQQRRPSVQSMGSKGHER